MDKTINKKTEITVMEIPNNVTPYELATDPKYASIWRLTFNTKVLPESNKFRIHLRKRPSATATTSDRFSSKHYATLEEANEDVFDWRVDHEPATVSHYLKQWKATKLVPVNNEVSKKVKADESTNTLSPKRKHSVAMSCNTELQKAHGIQAMNPSILNYNHPRIIAASIQCVSNIKARKYNQLVKTLGNQYVRSYWIKELKQKHSEGDWLGLIKGGYDPEIANSLTPFDRDHALMKARHVAAALQVQCEAVDKNISMTWYNACSEGAQQMMNNIKGRTVAQWYRDMHQGERVDIGRFSRSTRGHASKPSRSPFRENFQLTMQFKSWARQDLEHLTIQKALNWVETYFLKDWSVQQLHDNGFPYPISHYMIGTWMKEIGFEYRRYKKCYYVDRHEDPDVVEARNIYIADHFETELREKCWTVMPLGEYKKTFMGKKKVKRITADDKKVGKFMDKDVYHFKDRHDRDWVELHVDRVFDYNDAWIDIALQSMSVRAPKNVKPICVMGQDETTDQPG